jgi:hypothetical protein
MDAVEVKLESRKNWTDWQEYQKQHQEELYEAYQAEEVEQEILHEFGENEPNDPETVVFSDPPEPSEQVELEEAVEETDAEEDDDEESIGSQMAKELLEGDHDLPSESEWREMSSDARAKTVAFL